MAINLLKIKHIILMVALVASFVARSQNAAETAKRQTVHPFDKYERTSLTYCLLDFHEDRYMNKLKEGFGKVTINDKYNDHSIKSPFILKAPYDRQYFNTDQSELIRQALEEKKTGSAVIAKWFSQKPDGSFSMDLIADRGVYNATDADVVKARAGKRGTSALQDAGESLLAKSYIVVYDYVGVETWDDYYDRQDARNAETARSMNVKPKRVYRVYSGYRGSARAYLYKVAWNDSLAAVFYEQAWKNPRVFDQMQFPITYVTQTYIEGISGAQVAVERTLGDIDLITMLEHAGTERALEAFSRDYDVFRVKTPIYTTHPITAKIGTKEDVKIDQRFFVYQMEVDAKGNAIAKRKGVIRASKDITDNRTAATGETKPTRFYQEAGKRIYPGMTMEEMDDFGASFSFGWAQRSLQGPLLRLDFNLAKIVNWSLFRLFIEGQLGVGSVKFGISNESHNVTSYNLAIGISKEIILLKNIHIEPFVAVQFDSTFAKFTDSQKSDLKSNGFNPGKSSIGVMAGLRLPINILYNLQLVPSVSVSTVMFSKNSTLFGSSLPQSFPISGFDGALPGTANPNANLNKNIAKWDITLRYKF